MVLTRVHRGLDHREESMQRAIQLSNPRDVTLAVVTDISTMILECALRLVALLLCEFPIRHVSAKQILLQGQLVQLDVDDTYPLFLLAIEGAGGQFTR